MTGSPLVMRQVVSLALLGCHLSACSTWRMVTVPPEQAIAGRPEQVRVTRAGGDVVVLIKPEIVQDSLKGKRAADGFTGQQCAGVPAVRCSLYGSTEEGPDQDDVPGRQASLWRLF